jgi:hypothetical protein
MLFVKSLLETEVLLETISSFTKYDIVEVFPDPAAARTLKLPFF